jgi:hypothetical protein
MSWTLKRLLENIPIHFSRNKRNQYIHPLIPKEGCAMSSVVEGDDNTRNRGDNDIEAD